MLRCLVLFALLFFAVPASAGPVYRCTGPQGRLAFQDRPCPGDAQQTLLKLPPPPPTRPTPQLAPPAHQPSTNTTAQPGAATSATPLPKLYRCRGAVNGKTYVSDTPNPPAYRAPLGVLGIPQMPLSRVYGPGGAGISAPGVGRAAHVASPLAGYYTWVRDRCRPMPRAALCKRLDQQLTKIDNTLREPYPPRRQQLEQRATTLREQLRNCR